MSGSNYGSYPGSFLAVYADLIERIAKMEYKELAAAQKRDSTVAIVAVIVEVSECQASN
jgi:hypothetical protein